MSLTPQTSCVRIKFTANQHIIHSERVDGRYETICNSKFPRQELKNTNSKHQRRNGNKRSNTKRQLTNSEADHNELQHALRYKDESRVRDQRRGAVPGATDRRAGQQRTQQCVQQLVVRAVHQAARHRQPHLHVILQQRGAEHNRQDVHQRRWHVALDTREQETAVHVRRGGGDAPAAERELVRESARGHGADGLRAARRGWLRTHAPRRAGDRQPCAAPHAGRRVARDRRGARGCHRHLQGHSRALEELCVPTRAARVGLGAAAAVVFVLHHAGAGAALRGETSARRERGERVRSHRVRGQEQCEATATRSARVRAERRHQCHGNPRPPR